MSEAGGPLPEPVAIGAVANAAFRAPPRSLDAFPPARAALCHTGADACARALPAFHGGGRRSPAPDAARSARAGSAERGGAGAGACARHAAARPRPRLLRRRARRDFRPVLRAGRRNRHAVRRAVGARQSDARRPRGASGAGARRARRLARVRKRSPKTLLSRRRCRPILPVWLRGSTPAASLPSARAPVPPAARRPSRASLSAGQDAHGVRFCACSLCATLWHVARIKCLCCGSTDGHPLPRDRERPGGGRGPRRNLRQLPRLCKNHAAAPKIPRSIRSPTMSRRSRSTCWCAKAVFGAAASIPSCSAIEARMTAKPAADPERLRELPSVDAVLREPAAQAAVAQFGRPALVAAAREIACGGARGAAKRSTTRLTPPRWRRRGSSAESGVEPAARLQPHRHGAAHQSRPRPARGGSHRSGGRRHARRGRARIRSWRRQARRTRRSCPRA